MEPASYLASQFLECKPMISVCESPHGFEDGQIVSYRATAGRLEVMFEFWNEQRGFVLFEGLIGIRDVGAIGMTVGSVGEVKASDFLASLVARHYGKPPETMTRKHFRFLDVDDGVMLDVVAESCSFAGIEHAQGR